MDDRGGAVSLTRGAVAAVAHRLHQQALQAAVEGHHGQFGRTGEQLLHDGATEGDAQLEVGQIIASQTRGRFESIASYSQLGIIPEIAKEVAKTAGSGQFLITIERPAGATGPLGSLSMSPSGGLIPGRITRLP